MRWRIDSRPGFRGAIRAIAAGVCLGAAWGWGGAGAATSATTPPGQDDAPAGAYTAAQAARGRAVYQEHCLSCHGSSLRGGANEFAAPALAGPFFFDAWGGRTVAELVAYSADNMPPDGELLPGADYLDVTAYILQVSRYPEGEAALTADSPALARGIERQP